MIKGPTPHLWYHTEAKKAAEYYVSIFPNSKLISSSTLSDTPSGDVELVTFEINGQRFDAIAAGPIFTFNESVSFMVSCDTQEEIDYYWEKLSAVPSAEQCGWCKDQWGLSWQIVPSIMGTMMREGDAAAKGRVTAAFLKMKKFDITLLEKAYRNEA
jgi:predicted 3-demethylubiquinone-9 3-methyltransferase (glyoxalase superfamily)